MTAGADSESGAVRRLTAGIDPPEHGEILARCLTGALTPAVTLVKLLRVSADAAAVRATVDEVTRRAAFISRATDSLLRDRVDDLTQLVVENEAGCEKIAEILRSNPDTSDSTLLSHLSESGPAEGRTGGGGR